MEGVYLGVEISMGGAYCKAAYYDPEKKVTKVVYFDDQEYQIPMSIGKIKGKSEWYIGREITKLPRTKVSVIDHLPVFMKGRDKVSIDGEKHSGEELMRIYMVKFLTHVIKVLGKDGIIRLTFCMESVDAALADQLVRISEGLGITRKAVQVINYKEAFLFFCLAKDPKYRRNECMLFELTNYGLFFYEFVMLRGRRPQPVIVNMIQLEKKFDVALLKKPLIQKTMDEKFLEHAKKYFNKKLISSVFLEGEGFKDSSWCKKFKEYICKGRKVYQIEAIYAEGAAANSWIQNDDQYLYLCEGRVPATVSMNVIKQQGAQENELQLVLVKAGTNWYDTRSTIELLLEDSQEIELKVEIFGRRLSNTYKIACPKVENRPIKTTRVELNIAFLSDDYLMIRIKDLGFGELFPSTGLETKEYIRLT
ncbi:hypothetical protein P261_01595 [Lachnospiraceae bacterium TWA4]|nr:hypothetical protein P261_01595 [Lachnospiraceae bacterium TWA4]